MDFVCMLDFAFTCVMNLNSRYKSNSSRINPIALPFIIKITFQCVPLAVVMGIGRAFQHRLSEYLTDSIIDF